MTIFPFKVFGRKWQLASGNTEVCQSLVQVDRANNTWLCEVIPITEHNTVTGCSQLSEATLTKWRRDGLHFRCIELLPVLCSNNVELKTWKKHQLAYLIINMHHLYFINFSDSFVGGWGCSEQNCSISCTESIIMQSTHCQRSELWLNP